MFEIMNRYVITIAFHLLKLIKVEQGQIYMMAKLVFLCLFETISLKNRWSLHFLFNSGFPHTIMISSPVQKCKAIKRNTASNWTSQWFSLFQTTAMFLSVRATKYCRSGSMAMLLIEGPSNAPFPALTGDGHSSTWNNMSKRGKWDPGALYTNMNNNHSPRVNMLTLS